MIKDASRFKHKAIAPNQRLQQSQFTDNSLPFFFAAIN
jgi:hypothetical protein